MTVATHQHSCAEVDRLEDEVRDLTDGQIVYANEHMRMAAVFIAARAAVAALRLPGNDPNVDVDHSIRQSLERLMVAVDDAQDLAVHPDEIAKRIRSAIYSPASIVPQLMGERRPNTPAESTAEWKVRAVMHVLTHGAKAVNG